MSIFLLVYVDNIIVMGFSKKAVRNLINTLFSIFKLKDLGDLQFFLAMELTKYHRGVVLSQQHYIFDFIVQTNMQNSKVCLLQLFLHQC